jgi:hypothetical protein
VSNIEVSTVTHQEGNSGHYTTVLTEELAEIDTKSDISQTIKPPLTHAINGSVVGATKGTHANAVSHDNFNE